MTTEWGLDDKWERKLERYLAIAEQYADAKAEVENLENVKHTIIAMAMRSSKAESVAAQQREAHLSPEYVQWCKDVYVATKTVENLRLRLRAGELWFEMVRTQAATRRAEMALR